MPLGPQHTFPSHVRTAADQGQRSVIAQPVMVVDILSPQRQGHHRLCDKGLEEMINTRGIAIVNETGCQTSGGVEQAIGFPGSRHRHRKSSGRRRISRQTDAFRGLRIPVAVMNTLFARDRVIVMTYLVVYIHQYHKIRPHDETSNRHML